MCADTQRCYNSDIVDQCWPNCWRSSSRGYTLDICIHQSNAVFPDMVSAVQQQWCHSLELSRNPFAQSVFLPARYGYGANDLLRHSSNRLLHAGFKEH